MLHRSAFVSKITQYKEKRCSKGACFHRFVIFESHILFCFGHVNASTFEQQEEDFFM